MKELSWSPYPILSRCQLRIKEKDPKINQEKGSPSRTLTIIENMGGEDHERLGYRFASLCEGVERPPSKMRDEQPLILGPARGQIELGRERCTKGKVGVEHKASNCVEERRSNDLHMKLKSGGKPRVSTQKT